MKLTTNLSVLSAVRPLTPPTCNTPEHAPSFPMRLHIVSMNLSTSLCLLSLLTFFICFYLDRKTPEVFLVGNSWRGMLLREQGVRVESRFSGSCLTPCSTIPSPSSESQPASCQDSQRCWETLACSRSAGSWGFGCMKHLCSVSLWLCFFSTSFFLTSLCLFNYPSSTNQSFRFLSHSRI